MCSHVWEACSGAGLSENHYVQIINQPIATNGIKPSFEADFTVRASATKSRAVSILHESTKHGTEG